MTGYTAFADKVELARHAAALWLDSARVFFSTSFA